MVTTYPTPVDASTTTWPMPQSLTVAIRPVTDDLRRHHFNLLPRTARFAAVEYDTDRHTTVLGTNADQVNLVDFARRIASIRGARFVEPDACCEYCNLPVSADARWCAGTDCQVLDGGRETAWWRDYPQTRGLVLTAGGWAA